MNEDILDTILRYRNRSQGLNKTVIMKIPLNNLEQTKNEDNNIKNDNNTSNTIKNDNNTSNTNNISTFRIKNSKSYANLKINKY